MKTRSFARSAAACGVLAGIAAVGGGLYAHAVQPEFGTPGFFGLRWDQGFSGVGMLVGLGAIMVLGGLLSFRWPSLGAAMVCVAAMVGLVYTFDRGEWRWVPLLYYWALPWLFAWLAGIFAGYALHERVEPHGNAGGPGAAAPVSDQAA
jgi:hypothetical protein